MPWFRGCGDDALLASVNSEHPAYHKTCMTHRNNSKPIPPENRAMKRKSFLLVVALGCLVAAGPAFGQTLKQPASVQPVASDYSYYLEDEPSPSDVAQPVVTGGAAGCDVDGCTSCGGSCFGRCRNWSVYNLFPNSDCSEPWRLFPELPYDFTLTGWVQAGATVNEWSTPSRYNGPVAFNDRRELQVNQIYAILERQADTGGEGWDWGARVDVLYGTDFIFNQMTGWETTVGGGNKWNSGTQYGIVTPQVYGEIAYNRLSLKIGRFYTIMGYENTQATSNFFYSHSYTLMYGEPFMHTGGLFTYEYNNNWTAYGGLVNGWDQFDGPSDKLAVLGGATYTPDHGAYSITGTFISGSETIGGGVYTPRTAYSIVFDWHINDRWEYVLQHDLGWQQDVTGPGADAEWYGVNQYLYYDLNECWKFGGRFEWFRDDDGFRVAGGRATNPYAGGSSGDFYAVTLGANWIPSPNVVVRPEVRYDWFDGSGPLPYNDGASDSQVTAALDFILRF